MIRIGSSISILQLHWNNENFVIWSLKIRAINTALIMLGDEEMTFRN